jgi:hypothetical protein
MRAVYSKEVPRFKSGGEFAGQKGLILRRKRPYRSEIVLLNNWKNR